MRNDLDKKTIVFGIVFSMVFSGISLTNLVGIGNADNVEMVDNKTSLFVLDYNLSEYWGKGEIRLTDGTGYFETYKDENDTWWFATPKGYAFYSNGHTGVKTDSCRLYDINVLQKYGSYENWANNTRENYRKWGFNTLGAWSNYSLFNHSIPYTHTFIFTHENNEIWARLLGERKKFVPNVFDPVWRQNVNKTIQEVTGKLKEDPWLIGYWLDNEIHWESNPSPDFNTDTLLETYISAPYEKIKTAKRAVVEFLRDRYNDDIDYFNEVWNMNLKCFDELYDREERGREGWRLQSKLHTARLKLIREDPKLLFNFKLLKRADSDIKDFAGYVAQTYFNYTAEVLRKYDPNHLILGVRFHCWGTPREVIEECGKHCDVVSINLYDASYNLLSYFHCLRKNLTPLNNWGSKYYEISGKPLIVGEWGSGPFGIFKKAINLKIVARYDVCYTKKCLETPYIIGQHGKHHSPTDEPRMWIVNVSDCPNKLLVEHMADINNQLYDIRREINN